MSAKDDRLDAALNRVGLSREAYDFTKRMMAIRAVPEKPGTWKCRHAQRPDLFDERGYWREGVDRMAL